MPDEVKPLAGPFEIFELTDGEVRELQVKRYLLGTVTIYPEHKPEGKTVEALRVWVPTTIKPVYPDYWDITSKTLVAQLLPQLQQPGFESKRFTITKHGIPPKARFTLEVRPA